MVLAASFEFEKSHNSEIVERPSDNEEVPQVGIISTSSFTDLHHLIHVMRKPVYAICKQQKHKSACTSVQSDQHLCCSLPR